jgi:hypothetical protein
MSYYRALPKDTDCAPYTLKYWRTKMNLQAAINTFQATTFEMLLVRLFGKRRTEKDLNGELTIATFRGKEYLIDYLRGIDA